MNTTTSATARNTTPANSNSNPTPVPKIRAPPPTYPAYSTFPTLAGETVVSCTHLLSRGTGTDSTTPDISIPMSRMDTQFQPSAQYHGPSSSPSIIYWNFVNYEWYIQKLPHPRYTIWILLNETVTWDRGYVKRRFVEEAIRRNIQVECLVPSKFRLSWGKGMGMDVDTNTNTNTDSTHTSTSRSTHLYYSTRGWLPLPAYVIPRLSANLLDYRGRMLLHELASHHIPILNDMASLTISSDKLATMQMLNGNGIPIPDSYLLSQHSTVTKQQLDAMEQACGGYPLIMKCTAGSKGESVWKMNDRDGVMRLLSDMKDDAQATIVCQRFIASSSGRDIRCFVIGSRVIAGMMRCSTHDFRSNVALGGEGRATHIGPELANMACQAAHVAGLECAGVDCLMDTDTYRICELNGNPGCEGLERATGMNVVAAMLDYVMQRIESKQQPSNTHSDQ